jgi:GGDEF domain-containing protein
LDSAGISLLIPLNNKYHQSPELNMSLGAAARKKNEPLEKTMLRADNSMYQEKAAHHHRRVDD